MHRCRKFDGYISLAHRSRTIGNLNVCPVLGSQWYVAMVTSVNNLTCDATVYGITTQIKL